MRTYLVMLAAALTGCVGQPSQDWNSMDRARRLVMITRITAQCKLAPETLSLGQGDELHFKPRPDERYEAVECALKELMKVGGAKMGFVGNEAYTNEVR